MFDLIKLRYVLNEEYFFSSSVIFKDIPETSKKIIFTCYSLLKALFFIFILFIIQILILSNQSKLYLFDFCQLILFLICTFYFSNIVESENNKTHIKDFLIGTHFNYNEKIVNKKKLTLLYFFEACAFYFLTWLILIPLIPNISFINLLVAFLLLVFTLINVYSQNYNSKQKKGSKYWIMKYFGVGLIAFGIIQYWNYFKIDIRLDDYELERNILFLMILSLTYQIVNIIVSLKKIRSNNQNVGGLLGDFIEKYLSSSAIIYFVPIVTFNIITISQVSKVLFIVSYISFFVMPNVVSLNFLNYYKIIGNSKDVLIKYGQMILILQMSLALIIGFLCGVNFINLLLIIILLIIIMLLRIWVAIWVVNSKHEDGQKTDYYAISMFIPVILLITLAFSWR